MTDLKTKILETVKKENITMIPKWKFVLYSFFGITGVAFIFLVAVFVFSLSLFVLSRYGYLDMPFFGFMATLHALNAIPTALLVCTIVLLGIIEMISRQYSFSFRRPLAVTLLFLASVVTIISFIVSQTSVHEYIREYVRENHIPGVEHMYNRPLPFPPRDGMNVIRGLVVSATATSTTVRLFDGTVVVAYATTTSEREVMLPKVGEDIVMLGALIGDRFEIRKIRPAMRVPFGRPMEEKRNFIMKGMIHEKNIIHVK